MDSFIKEKTKKEEEEEEKTYTGNQGKKTNNEFV